MASTRRTRGRGSNQDNRGPASDAPDWSEAFRNIADAVREQAAITKEQAAVTTRILEEMRANAQPAPVNNAALVGNPDFHDLSEFRKGNPPSFQGEYDPIKAEEWLRELEKIFTVMRCRDDQKLSFATYMLKGEAEHWWNATKRSKEVAGVQITWELFRDAFLDKYFPRNLQEEKEMEFLELKQGNMTISQYLAKFDELSKFSSYFRYNPDENWKCVKFETGLKDEIRKMVRPLVIRDFSTLVDRCRIVESETSKLPSEFKPQRFYKRKRDDDKVKKNVQWSTNQQGKGKQIQKEYRGPKCPKCGRFHGNITCQLDQIECFVCGKKGHYAKDCPQRQGTTTSSSQQRGATTPRPQTRGRVFTLSSKEVAQSSDLIQDKTLVFLSDMPPVNTSSESIYLNANQVTNYLAEGAQERKESPFQQLQREENKGKEKRIKKQKQEEKQGNSRK